MFCSKLTPAGDSNLINSLTRAATLNSDGTTTGTIFNFFSPTYGFISVTIPANTVFYNGLNGQPISVTHPNNLGVALNVAGDSYAGLTFYGINTNKIIDKPTRLTINYAYNVTNNQKRTKLVDLEDNNFGNWVNAMHPDTVMDNGVFYIAGNEFKYPHMGLDQAGNQYSANSGVTPITGGPHYLVNSPAGYYPVFEVDPSLTAPPLFNQVSNLPSLPGPPFRYRRPLNPANTNYVTNNPTKIGYLKFDLTTLPYDIVLDQAILEVYFCSGFTIRQGKDTNLILNNNEMWRHSRLSGNGKTYVKTTSSDPSSSIILPMNNQHWRKNFFEILVPYAFLAQETLGLTNIFNAPNQQNVLPQNSSPQDYLQYLGFINLDEIDISLLVNGNTNEVSVGLTNIVLTQQAVVYQINGVVQFVANANGTYTPSPVSSNLINPNTIIANGAILPNMKILIYPFGINSNTLYYGYVKSILPASFIGFDETNLAIYLKALNYVVPLYSQYTVKLLGADDYLTYATFGRDSGIQDTQDDIAF